MVLQPWVLPFTCIIAWINMWVAVYGMEKMIISVVNAG